MSLRELHADGARHDVELQGVRCQLLEAEERRQRGAEALEVRLAELESGLVGLEQRQVGAREALEGLSEEARQKLETLVAVSQGATLTLEDHERRLGELVAQEQRGKKELGEELERLRGRVEEEMGKQNGGLGGGLAMLFHAV